MSNIHSFADIKRDNPGPQRGRSQSPPQRSQPQTNDPFQGTARTVNGDVIETPKPSKPRSDPLPADFNQGDFHQEVIYQFEQFPPELNMSFWTPNVEAADFTCGTLCCMSYCPCTVGPCCNETRKNDYFRLLKTATFWITLVQIIMYIVSLGISSKVNWMLEPTTKAIADLGADNRWEIKNNVGFWRMFTSILLHGSIFHILFNLFTQSTICLGFEASWGLWRYLIVYWGSGFVGSLFGMMSPSTSYAVGASCAICGTLGCFVALIGILWYSMPGTQKMALIQWLIVSMVLMVAISFLPHIDWVGHVGGFLGGAFIGCIIFWQRAETETGRIIVMVVGIIGLIICVGVSLALLIALD